jgi:peptide/nickel transport system substrate-binding protein
MIKPTHTTKLHIANSLVYLLITMLVLTACTSPTVTSTTTDTPAEPSPTLTPQPSHTLAPSPTSAPSSTPTSKPTPTPRPEVRNVLTIHLKPGLHWSDGSPLTATDLVGTYNILWAQKNGIWNSLKDVVAQDDTTVDFLIKNPSPRLLYQILRTSPIAPYSLYQPWMEQTGDARSVGYLPDSDEVKQVLDNLYAFRPDSLVVSGPFILNPLPLTKTDLELARNPSGYHADQIDFKRLVVYSATAGGSTTMAFNNKIDYSQYPTTEIDNFKNIPNMQVMFTPTGEGPGLWFNQAIYPLDKKEVRQAFAYIIDRQQNARASVGEAGKAVRYLTGMTDTQVASLLDPQTITQLNPYVKDRTLAENLLKSVGCARDDQGLWLDDMGAPMSYTLSAPANNLVWVNAAKDVAGQLTDFGIQASVQTYAAEDRVNIQKEGRYQVLVDLGAYYSPVYPYPSFAFAISPPRNNPEAKDNMFGMKWPFKQAGPGGKEYNIRALVSGSTSGFDIQAQKSASQTLALIMNEQLPVLPLFENYTAAPVNMGFRVDGWLPLDDPIYLNSQQTDNPVSIQFLDGTLKKSAKGDGSFATAWTYPRLQPSNLNYFDRRSILQNMGKFTFDVMYPPLFWFMWADGTYAPVLAESYEIK